MGLTDGAALYTGGILKYGLLLNAAPGEIWWLLLVVLGTAAADSGAYFVGRALGRRKLSPHISPNKTWAGFWGGMACCVLAVAVFAGPMHIPALHVLPLGVAVGLSSVVGDLAESLLKRSFGVKDSSRLIPGHGGLLDRLDSILFVLLVVYSYMHYFYG
jgi:phosphatidate cytidylyltransferase